MIQLIQGDALETLKQIEDESVHCIITSPPYWGLRDYGVEGQLGLEPTPEEYVNNLVVVFREARRVLRRDGTLWLNLGDSYAGNREKATQSATATCGNTKLDVCAKVNKVVSGLKPKDLCMIPAEVAIALRKDGWHLRSDIIWCLSGGTEVYARTRKGDTSMTVKDMARLDPKTVQLWNGTKWTQLLGMSRSERRGDELELVLRSGERISCTPTHKFPTDRGVVEAKEIQIGDILKTCILPEPEKPKKPKHIGSDAAWLAGLYLAEGSMSGQSIQIAGHAAEEERWNRCRRIAEDYGGYCTRTIDGNNMAIRMYGKVLCSIIDKFVSGKNAKTKHFAPVVWRYSNDFLEHLLLGYLSGDGHWDEKNNRWRIGFTRNYNLEQDLRTLAARLGLHMVLNMTTSRIGSSEYPSFKGEIRFERSGHWNEKEPSEIIEIRRSRGRYFWDLGVEDEPHLFALASGILTHNSKPNAMPESVTDRPTKAHEYIFLLSKSQHYYYDHEAIKEPAAYDGRKDTLLKGSPKYKKGVVPGQVAHSMAAKGHERWEKNERGEYVRNKRSVWTVPTRPFPEAHFAVYPPALITPCILAGTSPMACPHCGAPWERVVERIAGVSKECPKTQAAHEARGGTGKPSGTVGKSGGGRIDSISRTIGWRPTCSCSDNDGSGRCVVLDPFAGSGTTLLVATQHNRKSIGIELNPEYIEIAKRRLNSVQLKLVME